MTIKNKKIDYINQIVEDIIKDLDINSERIHSLDERKIEVFDHKMFKIHKLN